jgi:hypothetical protein
MNAVRFGKILNETVATGPIKWGNRKTLTAKGESKNFGNFNVVAEEGFFKGHYKATFKNDKETVVIKQTPTSYIEREIFGNGEYKLHYDSREIVQNYLSSDARQLFQKLADPSHEIRNTFSEP